ncbi:YCF48-related protein [Pseudomonas sp. R3.Fl]|uniref:WD40/YVTN/BNR-like repeat-containing protein n=1 Tax=Pseudomonas sp. R3.Fl TaxID=2928708 RepID=UPI00201DC561|nr:YCF48-related protein [Pseudomonas sp. R3.Fl]MCL6692367.1 YCF48-related protein [Pseudomonas sp. R3.Fl]
MNEACRFFGVRSLHLVGLTLCGLLAGLTPGFVQASFVDPIDHPAVMVSHVEQRPLQAVARAGHTLVAVGARGVIATSEDEGQSWTQRPSPVQSDLVAVTFPSPMHGWAVGHDGVVLHSGDGGMTWEKQLDGRLARELFTHYYEKRGTASDGTSELALASVERNYAGGPVLPWLDVWFEDTQRGWVVGSFGNLAATIDGGRTWQPWFEHIDNEEMLNLNAVRGNGGDVYIAAERGTLFRLDRAAGRFEKIETGYDGSFFGLTAYGSAMLTYGLNGAVYRSDDHGQRWTLFTAASRSTVTGGAALPDEQGFVLVNAGGELLLGSATGTSLMLRKALHSARFTSVLPLNGGRLLLTSLEGVRSESLNDAQASR